MRETDVQAQAHGSGWWWTPSFSSRVWQSFLSPFPQSQSLGPSPGPVAGIDQKTAAPRTAAKVALCLLQRGSITASADVLTKMIRARSKIAGSHTTASKGSATKMASLSTSPKIVQNPDSMSGLRSSILRPKPKNWGRMKGRCRARVFWDPA